MRRLILHTALAILLLLLHPAAPRAGVGSELEEMQKMAELGSAEFQFKLYRLYAQGGGPVAADPRKALEWLTRAAQNKYGPAEELLGLRYLEGEGVRRSPEKAFAWISRAAHRGEVHARYLEGRMHLDGIGTSRDAEKGIAALHSAAGHGHLPALESLGELYFFGGPAAVDYDRAREYFDAALLQNSGKSFFYLGLMYWEGLGVAPDAEEAYQLFRNAAELGYGPGINALGVMYAAGVATDRPDDAEAARCFRRAADRGVKSGEYNMWVLIDAGRFLPESPEEEVPWVNTAAALGRAGAQGRLGMLYEKGIDRGGHLTGEGRLKMARYWYYRAARGGDRAAQSRLSRLLHQGSAGVANWGEAYAWGKISGGAEATLEAIRSDSDPAEIDTYDAVFRKLSARQKLLPQNPPDFLLRMPGAQLSPPPLRAP